MGSGNLWTTSGTPVTFLIQLHFVEFPAATCIFVLCSCTQGPIEHFDLIYAWNITRLFPCLNIMPPSIHTSQPLWRNSSLQANAEHLFSLLHCAKARLKNRRVELRVWRLWRKRGLIFLEGLVCPCAPRRTASCTAKGLRAPVPVGFPRLALSLTKYKSIHNRSWSPWRMPLEKALGHWVSAFKKVGDRIALGQALGVAAGCQVASLLVPCRIRPWQCSSHWCWQLAKASGSREKMLVPHGFMSDSITGAALHTRITITR